MLIDGEGNDWLVKGDEGDDTIFLGPGVDKVFAEQGNDTVYVLDDGQADKIRCDDGGQEQGDADRVFFVGSRDPLDVVDRSGLRERERHRRGAAGLALTDRCRLDRSCTSRREQQVQTSHGEAHHRDQQRSLPVRW